MLPERARVTVDEIASRLGLGRIAIYTLLEKGEIPAIRLGRRWIITRFAYDAWEHNCGIRPQRFGVESDHGSTQTQIPRHG